MNAENKNAILSEQDADQRLWARVGMTLRVSEATREKIAAGDHDALKAVLLGKEGTAQLDGETYFPEEAEENAGLNMKYDFDFAPTSLHDYAERLHTPEHRSSQAPQKPSVQKNPNQKTYYYTFGTDDTQPYQKGWVEVQAENRLQSDFLFRMRHPDRYPGALNCASVYDQEQFKRVFESYKASPDWCICHETIGLQAIQIGRSPLQQQTEANKDSLEAKIQAAHARTGAEIQAPNHPEHGYESVLTESELGNALRFFTSRLNSPYARSFRQGEIPALEAAVKLLKDEQKKMEFGTVNKKNDQPER